MTLDQPTRKMREEAAKAGQYHSKLFDRDYPKVQILTFKELLEERKHPDLPPSIRPSCKRAKRFDRDIAESKQLGWDEAPDDALEDDDP